MASLRRVRKHFREEVLRSIRAGEGNFETLMRCAGKHFGHDVGYETLIKTFLGTEVSNAVSVLRNEGHVETVGKKWKLADQLQMEDVQIISLRRLKRLRGELKQEIQLAHAHGLTEEAVAAARALEAIEAQLATVEVYESQEETMEPDLIGR
jgi:hypothetical protein